MSKESGRRWDGRSRIPTEQYKKNFDSIFKKPKKKSRKKTKKP